MEILFLLSAVLCFIFALQQRTAKHEQKKTEAVLAELKKDCHELETGYKHLLEMYNSKQEALDNIHKKYLTELALAQSRRLHVVANPNDNANEDDWYFGTRQYLTNKTYSQGEAPTFLLFTEEAINAAAQRAASKPHLASQLP